MSRTPARGTEMHQHHHSRIRDPPGSQGTYGTPSAILNAYSQNKPKSTLGATTEVPAHGAVLRPGPSSLNTTEGPWRSLKDIKGIIAIAKKVKPQWDGDPTPWKQFWRDWENYWDLKGSTHNENTEVIKMEFIDCLPKDEKERANWSFAGAFLFRIWLSNMLHRVPVWFPESLWRKNGVNMPPITENGGR